MAYTNSEKKAEQTRENPGQSENRSERGAVSYDAGLPNSMMLDFFADGDDNSSVPPTVFREFKMPNSQIPSAEAEADHLSAGIRGTSPDSVRREMGNRLHADLSGVRFHSDLSSENRAAQMGARAWTSGRDVYFGKGGFEPRVAAHELVHTVQQSASRSPVTQSVTPGTVQMWPWSKRVSIYDEDRTPEDIADNLFRVQAGLSANTERKNAIRDTEYSKVYDKSLKRINKANRGLIREEGSEEQDQQDARNEALQRANNKQTGNKDYVSNDDKTKFISQIRFINRETYEEMLSRWLKAAEELCVENRNSNDTEEKRTYLAANSDKGKNYKLYNKLIKKIDKEHANNENFRNWKNEFLGKNRNAAETFAIADSIMDRGTSAENTYLKSDEGSRRRGKTATENKEYYKKIYRKKKTRIDRMAAVLRKRKENNTQKNIAKNNLIDVPDRNNSGPNLISNDDSFEFVLEGLPENDVKNTGKSRQKNNESIISNGMKEKNDESSVSEEGMKENDDDNIISTSSKYEEKDDGGVNGTVKQAVIDHVSKQEKIDEQNKDDPNAIIRQRGILTDELAEDYASQSPVVSSTKHRSGNAKFANNLIKATNGLNQVSLSAYYGPDVLKNHNLVNNYVTPAISGTAGLMGAGLGVTATATGAADTMRNIRNVKAGGSHLDWVTSGLDTLGAVGDTLSGGLSAMKNAGAFPAMLQISPGLVNTGQFGGPNMIPGLNVATGGISMITGGIEGIRGQKSINTINKQISDLKRMGKFQAGAADQDKLMQIFKQGKRVGELHRTGGAMKAVGGSVALTTGILLLSGPLAPVTAAALGLAGAAAGITNFLYTRKKKARLRKDVTAEEMNIDNWEAEKERVRKQFPGEKLSNDEVKEIILKSNRIDAKTRKEAFKQINSRRAKMLLEIIKSGGPLSELAEKVIGALGVSKRNGHFSSGAERLIAEKLGG